MRSLFMKFLFRNFEANQRFSGHIFFIVFLSSLGINNFLINCVAITFHTFKVIHGKYLPISNFTFYPNNLEKTKQAKNFKLWALNHSLNHITTTVKKPSR